MRWMALLVFVAVLPIAAAEKPERDRRACEATKKAIARVESRMRAGYTAKQGRRLEERLRRLREQRYRVCR